MTLIEHLRELRTRLFWAALAIVVGLMIGFALSKPVFALLEIPYCGLDNVPRGPDGRCGFLTLAPADNLVVRLQLSLWLGLIISAPVWLYQLWAFVAPGLHRHERRYAYVFAGVGAPLFVAGAALAYAVLEHGLTFLLEAGVTGINGPLEIKAYFSFISTMLLLFGVAFEFPLLLLMLNLANLVSARRMASWWRAVVFGCFAFAAVATPDPGPFGMTLLAAALCLLYVMALGVAWLNDRRRARAAAALPEVDDDELSPLEPGVEPVEALAAVEPPVPVPAPAPLASRYDQTT